MLNIEVNRSAKGVEQYFDCELAVSDYLMKELGVWAGRGAERLGLRGSVQRSQFVALAKRKSHDGRAANGTHEYELPGRRRNGQKPAGWLATRVGITHVLQN